MFLISRYKTILKPIMMGNNIFSRTSQFSSIISNQWGRILPYFIHYRVYSFHFVIYRRSFNFLEITKLIISKIIIQFSIQVNCVLIRLSILITRDVTRFESNCEQFGRIWTVTSRIRRDTCAQQVFHPTENFHDTLESVRLGKPLYSSGSRTWYEYCASAHGATHVAIKGLSC